MVLESIELMATRLPAFLSQTDNFFLTQAASQAAAASPQAGGSQSQQPRFQQQFYDIYLYEWLQRDNDVIIVNDYQDAYHPLL